jgi:hypothetical protein
MMKQVVLRKLAIATSTVAFAALLTVGWSVENAEARRLYVTPHYGFGPYIADQSGLPWYAVRAYYAGGPWCGVGGAYGYGGGAGGPWNNSWTCYSGWNEYKQRNGIGCDPGTLIKGGDGIMYVCQ